MNAMEREIALLYESHLLLRKDKWRDTPHDQVKVMAKSYPLLAAKYALHAAVPGESSREKSARIISDLAKKYAPSLRRLAEGDSAAMSRGGERENVNDKDDKPMFAGTLPRLDGKADFAVTGVEWLGDGVQLNWQTVSAGFGQLYFYKHADGKMHINTELMGPTFIKAVLCKIVDDAVLDDQ